MDFIPPVLFIAFDLGADERCPGFQMSRQGRRNVFWENKRWKGKRNLLKEHTIHHKMVALASSRSFPTIPAIINSKSQSLLPNLSVVILERKYLALDEFPQAFRKTPQGESATSSFFLSLRVINRRQRCARIWHRGTGQREDWLSCVCVCVTPGDSSFKLPAGRREIGM